MEKNKKTVIILIVIAIGLIFCASLIIYNHSFNNQQNIINIDDCTDKDCNKNDNKTEDKNKDDKKSNDNKKTDNNGSNSNVNPNTNGNSNNGNSNQSGGTSGNGTGNGSSNGSSSSGNGQGTGSGSESGSGSGTTPSDEPAPDIIVKDNTTTWEQNTNINIFNVDAVAPGDSGSYEFVVNNNTGGNVVYSIDFNEDNQYNVNLLYKLKMNGNYISGDENTWVNSSKLNLKDKVLDSEYMDSFYLEWKWVDTDHDTIAGTTPGAKYTLNVNVESKKTTDHDTSGSGSTLNPNTGDKITLYLEMLMISIIGVLLVILLKRRKNESS